MPHRSKPPRSLSLYSQAALLCSGIYAVMGWAFFCFGMIFVWIFVINSSVMLWFSPKVDWQNSEGRIIKVTNTNASENEEEIYAIHYMYFVNGQQYTGKGYMKGDMHLEGDPVAIKYNPNQYSHSRLINGRVKMFNGWVAFVLLFPVIGLILIYKSLKENYRNLQLIKNGYFITGTMLSKEPTGSYIEINNVEYPIFKYEFQFMAKGKERIAQCKTHKTNVVEDEVEEFILYNYDNPDDAIVFDAITNAPAIDNHGQLIQVPYKKAYVLIAPLLTFIIHVPWALIIFS